MIYSGMYMGSVLGLTSCPYLIQHFGWPSVFYVFGATGIAWYAVWEKLVASSPDTSKVISESEKEYIQKQLPPSKVSSHGNYLLLNPNKSK